MKTFAATRTVLAASITAVSTSGFAAQIEEIVVTTQKREQSLKDVPIAVSAFSGDLIESAQISDAKEVALLTPGVSGDTDDSFLDTINIRGISTNDFGVGAEPSVGVYQNGIYLGRTGGAMSSFFDLSQVEVIKGPQGTLFGRNASAGAFSITTRKPEEAFGGSVDVGVGEDGYQEFTGVLNMPINEHWGSRLAVYNQAQDGWVRNVNNGDDVGDVDVNAGRFTIAYEGPSLSGSLVLEYEDREGPPTIYRAFDPENTGISFFNSDADKDEFSSDVPTGDLIDEGEVWGVTLTFEKDIGDFSLTSITGIRGHNYFYGEDFDGEDLFIFNYIQAQEQKYYSQEFRLNYNGAGPVTWFIGASAYKEELDVRFDQTYDEDTMCASLAIAYAPEYGYEPDYVESYVTNCDSYYYFNYGYYVGLPGVGERNDSVDVDAEYEGWGIYGDATWHVTDRMDITLGARYTEDRRDFATRFGGENRNYFFYSFPFFSSGFVSDANTWENFSARIAANYEVNEDVSVYATIATGYKAGGYNTFNLDFSPSVNIDDIDGDDALDLEGARPADFDEEEVTNYELGMKSLLWDARLQLNASIYYYDFEGMQAGAYDGPVYVLNNIGDAEGEGIELDIRILPVENLDIYLGLSWADTELTDTSEPFCSIVGCEKGAQLSGTLEFSGAMVATYKIPVNAGEFFVTWEVFHQDDSPGFGEFNKNPVTLDGFTTHNARVGFDSLEDWSVTLWVNNANDEFYYKGVASQDSNIAPHHFGFSEPRRAGVDFSWKF